MWSLEGTKKLVYHVAEFEFGNLAETFQSFKFGLWRMRSIMHSVLLSGHGQNNSPTYDLPTHRKHKAATVDELNYLQCPLKFILPG
jgi:hypothetical protein